MVVLFEVLVILVLSLMTFLPITMMSFTETASLGASTGEDELTEQHLRATSGNDTYSSQKLSFS